VSAVDQHDDLDDLDIATADPGGMLGQVASAGDQARAALAATQSVPLVGPAPGAVVVAGMGGSGIAGDVLAALAYFRSPVPVLTVKGDRLPAFVGPSTLLVAVSYSGATDETLAAVEEGLSAGARLVAVCSGGRLAELAQRHGAPVALVAPGRMPRAALWSLTVPVCLAAAAPSIRIFTSPAAGVQSAPTAKSATARLIIGTRIAVVPVTRSVLYLRRKTIYRAPRRTPRRTPRPIRS